MKPPRSPRTGLAITLALIGLGAPSPAIAGGPGSSEAPPSDARRAYDAVVLRPLAFVNFVGAAVVYPVAYPLALPFDGEDTVQRVCWDEPAERVFRRPLGEL